MEPDKLLLRELTDIEQTDDSAIEAAVAGRSAEGMWPNSVPGATANELLNNPTPTEVPLTHPPSASINNIDTVDYRPM